jgi:hypothetical protein
MVRAAVTRMVSLVEFAPEGSSLLHAAVDPMEPDRNVVLFTYLRLRRMAADRGPAAAVREAEWLVRSLPGSALERAWDARWSGAPSKALDSGLSPLPRNDALRTIVESHLERRTLVNPACLYADWLSDEDWNDDRNHRLNPNRERVELPTDKLIRQFRAWSTLAELERREATASPEERADLLYKRAAVYFHEPYALFPVYARRAEWRSGLPEPWSLGGGEAVQRTAYRWMRRTFSRERASALFQTIVRDYPSSAVADRALYSVGLTHLHSLDDPTIRWWSWDREPLDDERRRHAREGVEAFERLAAEWPQSPLRLDAAHAAGWWRRNRSFLLTPHGD